MAGLRLDTRDGAFADREEQDAGPRRPNRQPGVRAGFR